MKPRNRIFIIMGVLLVIALCWYFFSTKRTSDLQLIGTVDANEVIVSSRIQGRIESLAVDEGQKLRIWPPPATRPPPPFPEKSTSSSARATPKNKPRAIPPARSLPQKPSSASHEPPLRRPRRTTSTKTPTPPAP